MFSYNHRHQKIRTAGGFNTTARTPIRDAEMSAAKSTTDSTRTSKLIPRVITTKVRLAGDEGKT